MTSSSSAPRASRTAIATAAIAALTLALCPLRAAAHFTLIGSREKLAFPDNNMRFFPIGMRTQSDCLNYPAGTSPMPIQAGAKVTLPFEIGNNARHVGPCTAQLVDITSGATTDLGGEMDCVNKCALFYHVVFMYGELTSLRAYRYDAMHVSVPPTATCGASCVVKIKVTATHRARCP